MSREQFVFLNTFSWIWKGVSATSKSGRYTLLFSRGRIMFQLVRLTCCIMWIWDIFACIYNSITRSLINGLSQLRRLFLRCETMYSFIIFTFNSICIIFSHCSMFETLCLYFNVLIIIVIISIWCKKTIVCIRKVAIFVFNCFIIGLRYLTQFYKYHPSHHLFIEYFNVVNNVDKA